MEQMLSQRDGDVQSPAHRPKGESKTSVVDRDRAPAETEQLVVALCQRFCSDKGGETTQHRVQRQYPTKPAQERRAGSLGTSGGVYVEHHQMLVDTGTESILMTPNMLPRMQQRKLRGWTTPDMRLAIVTGE